MTTPDWKAVRAEFPTLAKWTIEILASDISEAVLAQARLGQVVALHPHDLFAAPTILEHRQLEGARLGRGEMPGDFGQIGACRGGVLR